MARKRHTAEEIVSKLRHVDVLIPQGWQVADAARSFGVTSKIIRYKVRLNPRLHDFLPYQRRLRMLGPITAFVARGKKQIAGHR